MMVTIDRVGRVVIPKDIRERFNLSANTELELTVQGEEMLLRRPRSTGRRIVEVDGWPVIEPRAGMSIADADVQRWRDDDQR